MTIELSEDDRALLLELLGTELRQLKAEINRTETTSFREELKAREDRMVVIIRRLEEAAPVP